MAELTALGAEVRVVRCDVTDREQVAGVLAGIPAEHPLTGVVQVVGALDDGMLRGQTAGPAGAGTAGQAGRRGHLRTS